MRSFLSESLDQPCLCKRVCAVLYCHGLDLQQLEAELEQQWGRVERRSCSHPFSTGSSYYHRQMGELHSRYWLSFEGLVDPGVMVSDKRWAMDQELLWAKRGLGVSRPINLDSGLVMRGRLALATTKDFSHRLYLGRGLYGEVTVQFKKGEVIPLPWTYPDIAAGHYDEFLLKVKADFEGDSRRVMHPTC